MCKCLLVVKVVFNFNANFFCNFGMFQRHAKKIGCTHRSKLYRGYKIKK
ncbi:Hypothetical Protein SLY_0657 [Strawberry lethal yellows phytoplasma (CPA) str. NZSb11]|uniref:Uncharacterized protein n=1 Tax=Strawberry lethal yellows phytoplasma (CPA) str. NZSb11 TaxID=980422 RepID=R4S1D2_PHYAS|nr:Hypothetical Protein SLY_0657 [Strawberry lethal yellows phytoplasma (CPA) str. NZSb11]